MNLPKWITVVPFAGDASKGYWRVTDAVYLEDDGANCNVYAIAFDEKGKPAFNGKAIQRFPSWDKPDETIVLPFNANGLGQATASFPMDGNGSNFDPGRGEVGPQCLAMFGASDRVVGIGLPLRRHVTLTVTFQWTMGAPVPTPEPPPPSGEYVKASQFHDLWMHELVDLVGKG